MDERTGDATVAARTETFRVAEDQRLERAINLARWAGGAIAFGTGPAFPSLGWQYVLALGSGLFLYGTAMHLLTRPRPSAPREWPYRFAFWGDIAIILFAILVFAPDPIWGTFAFGLLVVIINGFRRGGMGALVTAGVISLGYVLEAWFRSGAFGYPFEVSRLGTNVTVYLLAALLMSGIVRELRALRGLYEPLLAAEGDLGQGVVVLGADGHAVYWNDAIELLTGYRGPRLGALPAIWDLFVPPDRPAIARSISSGTQTGKIETVLQRADGGTVPVELGFAPIKTAVGHRMVVLVRDVSETKSAWQALRDEALHDRPTGLPNRVLLDDRLEQATAVARRSGTGYSLLFIGIQNIKDIASVYGRPAVETLFAQIATRIGEEIRPVDTLARIGEVEFAVLLASTEVADAEIVARRVASALERPFRLSEDMIELAAGVGVAGWPAHADNPYELVRRAEIAMSAAVDSSDGYAVFASAQEPDRSRLLLLPELRRAIEGNELVLMYQPEVSVADGSVKRLEALVRWQRGDELVLPEKFVPIAERRGLIGALTLWVLGSAIRDLRTWTDAGWPLRVSVNVSIRNLLDPGFASTIARLCHNAGVDPRALGVEVTESVLMVEPGRTSQCLSELRGLGVHVAIDDFGTGYSSLAYLDRLPLDAVKIDRSFIQGLNSDAGCRAIIGATIDLGKHFGFELVAEGVEDEDTLRKLRALSIPTAQGFHICAPLPASEVVRWLGASHGLAVAPALGAPTVAATAD